MIEQTRVKFLDGSIQAVMVEFEERGTKDCTPMDRLRFKNPDCKWINKLFGKTVGPDSVNVCALLKGIDYETNTTIDSGYDYFELQFGSIK